MLGTRTCLLKKVPACDLFDGRLEGFGVREHVKPGGRGLLLQRFTQVLRARPHFLEQPDVADRDYGGARGRRAGL